MLPQVARVNADLSYPVVVVDAADNDHRVALFEHRVILLQLSARISLWAVAAFCRNSGRRQTSELDDGFITARRTKFYI
jgi:hypothetical protein